MKKKTGIKTIDYKKCWLALKRMYGTVDKKVIPLYSIKDFKGVVQTQIRQDIKNLEKKYTMEVPVQ